MNVRRHAQGQVAPRNSSAGVTLLELLVVLVIMAIVAAFVYPMFGGSGVSTGELKSAARQVAAGLRLARSEALATRKETRVLLDLEQRHAGARAARAGMRCGATANDHCWRLERSLLGPSPPSFPSAPSDMIS